jgi:hypothetical protein
MTLSEQARADAMADAETLRNYGWQTGGDLNSLLHRCGSFSRWAPQGPRFVDAAIYAASAAFRAVPGLRGDR